MFAGADGCGQVAARISSTWLVPGRNPGQPVAYATVFSQLRDLGFAMRTGDLT